jgi:hypothetical protein
MGKQKKKVQPVNYLHLINSIGGCFGAFFDFKSFSKICIIKTMLLILWFCLLVCSYFYNVTNSFYIMAKLASIGMEESNHYQDQRIHFQNQRYGFVAYDVSEKSPESY